MLARDETCLFALGFDFLLELLKGVGRLNREVFPFNAPHGSLFLVHGDG